MKRSWVTLLLAFSFLANVRAALDTYAIQAAIDLKGTGNEKEGVFKITVPRDDVKVSVDGMQMPPFMGLASWAAFASGMEDRVMVMGDTVLFEDEVNPVMSTAFDNGLSVTALHNHFFYDEQKVYFMHISGEGSPEKLAAAVKAVWGKVKEIRKISPVPARAFRGTTLPMTSSISVATLEEILGVKGQTNNGMFKIVIGRTAKMGGMDIGKDMGVNTWAAFAGADNNAVVDGDFAVTEEELQPALKSLRRGDINIVAIHSHMSGENPRILFFHYWGKGKAAELAKTLKTALDGLSR